jgi:hypothetical protein
MIHGVNRERPLSRLLLIGDHPFMMRRTEKGELSTQGQHHKKVLARDVAARTRMTAKF